MLRRDVVRGRVTRFQISEKKLLSSLRVYKKYLCHSFFWLCMTIVLRVARQQLTSLDMKTFSISRLLVYAQLLSTAVQGLFNGNCLEVLVAITNSNG